MRVFGYEIAMRRVTGEDIEPDEDEDIVPFLESMPIAVAEERLALTRAVDGHVGEPLVHLMAAWLAQMGLGIYTEREVERHMNGVYGRGNWGWAPIAMRDVGRLGRPVGSAYAPMIERPYRDRVPTALLVLVHRIHKQWPGTYCVYLTTPVEWLVREYDGDDLIVGIMASEGSTLLPVKMPPDDFQIPTPTPTPSSAAGVRAIQLTDTI